MKKNIAQILIFFYLGSFATPFAPAILEYAAKKVWTISHEQHIKNLDDRFNLLNELAEMAKHNNPKKNNSPDPNSMSKMMCSFIFIVPELNCSFKDQMHSMDYPTDHSFSVPFTFSQINIPPPKA
ncbi:MAG: hypothetical protein ABI763_04220 [Bacteroidota bacterium]